MTTGTTTSMNEQPSKPRRRWFRFSLRSLMLLVALVAVPMAFVPKIQRARNQRDVVELIDRLELGLNTVSVLYDFQIEAGAKPFSDETRRFHGGYARQKLRPPVPKWSLGLLGQDYFCEVVEVHFSHPDTNIIEGWPYLIARIATLPKIKSLSLITREDLAASDYAPIFLQMHNLETLKLCWVTDKSLEQISKLEHLESLSITSPLRWNGPIPITDEGVTHVAKLTNLRSLQLGIGGFDPSSGWGCTLISDDGLMSLYGLKSLEFFGINSTHITQAGIDKLQVALPNCQIKWNVGPTPALYQK